MSYHDLEPSDLPLDISAPEEISRPLWKSLYMSLRDRVAPDRLPPLALTSRPVHLGMLLGDYLGLPWYRSVFTNIGDYVLPDTQPPLQLESRPVDVGELLGDEIARPWWTSLVRNLADRIAPEKLPALQLESKAYNPFVPSDALLLTNWSNVIDGPKIFLPDPARPSQAAPALVLPVLPRPEPMQVEFVNDLERDLRRDLRNSRLRQRFLMAVFAAEVVFLFAGRYILSGHFLHR